MSTITKENSAEVIAKNMAEMYGEGDVHSTLAIIQLSVWALSDEDLLKVPVEEQYQQIKREMPSKKSAKMAMVVRLAFEWSKSKEEIEFVDWVEKNYPKFAKVAKKLSA